MSDDSLEQYLKDGTKADDAEAAKQAGENIGFAFYPNSRQCVCSEAYLVVIDRFGHRHEGFQPPETRAPRFMF
jgi:hypothetical protein